MTQQELKAVYRTAYDYHMECRRHAGPELWTYAATQLRKLGSSGSPFLKGMLVEVYAELIREFDSGHDGPQIRDV